MSNLRRYIPSGLVLIIGIVISLLVFSELVHHEKDTVRSDFKEVALERVNAVENRIAAELTIVKSIVGFFEGSNHVDRLEFQSFVKKISPDERSFQALEWIPRIPLSERAAYKLAARNDGFDDFQIKQKTAQGDTVAAATRDEYFPVYYIEPYKGNEGALGFDLASNPTRLAALEQARDNGSMVASGRINLVQLKENNTGILIFAPVFQKDQPRGSVEQRRQNLAGFALGVIRISSLISGLYNANSGESLKRPAGIDLYVYDEAEVNGDRLLYIHHSRKRQSLASTLTLNEARSGLNVEKSILVGGRKWTVIARSINPAIGQEISKQVWYSLFVLLLLTAMTTIYLASNVRRARDVENLVQLRTNELSKATLEAKDKEERISAILNNVIDGIITIDTKGMIEAFNPSAARIFGYSPDQVIGRNVKCLMPEPFQGEHDGYLQNYHDSGEAKIIGIGREVIGLRKDGSTFPMELAVSTMDVSGVQMYTGIVRDITDRKQAEMMKSEFVSTVSHELRTPLTSIKGSLGLIRSGALGELSDKLGSMVEIAYNNSERLVLLINDILDMEKIEAGKMDYHMQPVEVASLLKSAMEANQGYGDEHGVTFECQAIDDTIMVLGDMGRLMQVLSNLMSNAAKFSPDGERVDISVIRNDETIRIAVKDNGPGIPENFRASIFEKFSQADSSDTRQKGGTGLGLSITKAIVEEHGGAIGFDTVTGKGSTFYVELPELVKQSEIQPPEAGQDGQFHILICEDEIEIATILEQILGYAGYRTRTARSAAQARQLLQDDDFDAMTLDLGLPDQNGISLLQEIRRNKKTQGLPIIVVSATALEGKNEINGDAIGIIDWIEKPFDTQDLIARLGNVIGRPSDVRPRILHIEDDESVLEIISTLINGTADVIAATTISEARTLLQREAFDLVILDLMLPDGDGESLLPLLNKPGQPSTPVIIFSARDVSRETAESICAVLVKSQTSNEQLLNTIRSTIEVSQAQE